MPYYVRSGYVQETIVSAMRLLTGYAGAVSSG